jgi:hypothetical protein
VARSILPEIAADSHAETVEINGEKTLGQPIENRGR